MRVPVAGAIDSSATAVMTKIVIYGGYMSGKYTLAAQLLEVSLSWKGCHSSKAIGHEPLSPITNRQHWLRHERTGDP
jgi:hypothetical protein